MPELPEVETITRDLSARIEGDRIVSVSVPDASDLEGISAKNFCRILKGKVIQQVKRIGKMIVIICDNKFVIACFEIWN